MPLPVPTSLLDTHYASTALAMSCTSRNILHEDLEHTVLTPGPKVLDNVLVLQVAVQLYLLLQRLELTEDRTEWEKQSSGLGTGHKSK